MRYLVTGTNRGIGLELARQLLARGDEVIGTLRGEESGPVIGGMNPPAGAIAALYASGPLKELASERLRLVRCDVTMPESLGALAEALDGVALDVVINNAGVIGGMTSLERVDLADARRTFEVNALGPLAVVQVALPALLRGSAKQIVAISSGMGSIGTNTDGGAYAYRMSKAALNMAVRSMSVDLARRGFVCVVMNPGWVQTDMGGRGAPTPVKESVRLMLDRLGRLTKADNGRFLDYLGGEIEW